jgi:RNA polymerase sigma factor (sigma-70 family)
MGRAWDGGQGPPEDSALASAGARIRKYGRSRPPDPLADLSKRQRGNMIFGAEAALEPDEMPDRWLNFEIDETWERLRKVACDTAYKIVGSAHAEDMAQATLAVYGLALETIRNPEAWVTRVATNLSINFKKQLRREVLAEPEVLQALDETQAQYNPDEIDRLIARILVDELLDLLPDKQRATLELQYGRGLQRAQVADLLGLTIETVKEHRDRGVTHLRRVVRRGEEESYDGA